MREADLLVAVGGRLGEITTQGYTLLDVPSPRQTLVHVHPDPGELGRVYEPDLADRLRAPGVRRRGLRARARGRRGAAGLGPERPAPTTSRISAMLRCRATSTSAT